MAAVSDLMHALQTSDIGNNLPSNLVSQIMDYMETQHIFFCSHKGTDLIAYNIHSDYLGTIAKTKVTHDQWLTGFDFDSKGALYVACYDGFLVKYPMPMNESCYASYITPRNADKTFERNIEQTFNAHQLNDESAPEGVVVIDNDEYQSVFVTIQDPINGILQLSLTGVTQRIICPNLIRSAWSMKRVPSFFLQTTQSSFLKQKNLLMVEDGKVLHIIDINAGKHGQIMVSLNFPLSKGCVGDFTFKELHNSGLLLVNLQNGMFQFNQCEMFWMLKHLNINKQIEQFNVLQDKTIRTAYGTCVGPDGDIYFCDHSWNRIIKMKILDYDSIVNMDKINEDMDYNSVKMEIFCKGIDHPNYCTWIDAQRIGLNLVQFPLDVFEEVEPRNDNEESVDSRGSFLLEMHLTPD